MSDDAYLQYVPSAPLPVLGGSAPVLLPCTSAGNDLLAAVAEMVMLLQNVAVSP